jgi:uncharacterized protein (TIGR02588 family)
MTQRTEDAPRTARAAGDRGEGGRGAAAGGVGVSRWEWVVAAAGALLLLGTVAVLLGVALGGPRTPPALTVRATSVQPVAGGWRVEIEARNTGGTTAANVELRGELRAADGSVAETAEVHVDYAPARGTATGGMFFTRDPRAHALVLRAVGYEEP